MSWTPSDDLALARRLAASAAEVTLTYWRQAPREWRKPDGSIVTEADHATETRLRALIAEARPADAILGEEFGPSGSGPRRWILDGIDGTREFAEGLEAWGSLIALEVEGQVVLGYCVEPARHRHTWAMKGQGAFQAVGDAPPERLAVSATADLAAARVWVPPPHYIPDAAAQRGVDAVRAATTASADRIYHPALAVAAGAFDAAVFYTGGPWDLAAPALIVEEAGGRFSDVRGAWTIGSGCAVYSNGRLHEPILAVLASL